MLAVDGRWHEASALCALSDPAAWLSVTGRLSLLGSGQGCAPPAAHSRLLHLALCKHFGMAHVRVAGSKAGIVFEGCVDPHVHSLDVSAVFVIPLLRHSCSSSLSCPFSSPFSLLFFTFLVRMWVVGPAGAIALVSFVTVLHGRLRGCHSMLLRTGLASHDEGSRPFSSWGRWDDGVVLSEPPPFFFFFVCCRRIAGETQTFDGTILPGELDSTVLSSFQFAFRFSTVAVLLLVFCKLIK